MGQNHELETIQDATNRYEAWLENYVRVQSVALESKHDAMRKSPFLFFRATFYRWVQCFSTLLSKEQEATQVLSVGDLHVENFGTWRDAEGHLIWGINDLDEAALLPYSNDLVRLATSALLAIEDKDEPLNMDKKEACDRIWEGYHKGLKYGGLPFVLTPFGKNQWLDEVSAKNREDPYEFYKDLWKKDIRPLEQAFPSAYAALAEALTQPVDDLVYYTRESGKGSLGRPRVLLRLGKGKPYLEAKALLPSAAFWADPQNHTPEIYYAVLLAKAVRFRDPIQSLRGNWVVRMLSPESFRLKLDNLETKDNRIENAEKLMEAMGFETANLHLGTDGVAESILKDLETRDKAWLYQTANLMKECVEKDYDAYKPTKSP